LFCIDHYFTERADTIERTGCPRNRKEDWKAVWNLYHHNDIYLQRLARRHIMLPLALNFTWLTVVIQRGRCNLYVPRIANSRGRLSKMELNQIQIKQSEKGKSRNEFHRILFLYVFVLHVP